MKKINCSKDDTEHSSKTVCFFAKNALAYSAKGGGLLKCTLDQNRSEILLNCCFPGMGNITLNLCEPRPHSSSLLPRSTQSYKTFFFSAAVVADAIVTKLYFFVTNDEAK